MGNGHVGVGVNTSNTVGFYPTTRWCLAADCSVNGQAPFDSTMQNGVSPASTLTIHTTPAQDQAMQQAINSRRNNPGKYNLYGRNCAKFVEDVLNAGGIPNVPDNMIPNHLYQTLQQMYSDPYGLGQQLAQPYINAGAGINVLNQMH